MPRSCTLSRTSQRVNIMRINIMRINIMRINIMRKYNSSHHYLEVEHYELH